MIDSDSSIEILSSLPSTQSKVATTKLKAKSQASTTQPMSSTSTSNTNATTSPHHSSHHTNSHEQPFNSHSKLFTLPAFLAELSSDSEAPITMLHGNTINESPDEAEQHYERVDDQRKRRREKSDDENEAEAVFSQQQPSQASHSIALSDSDSDIEFDNRPRTKNLNQELLDELDDTTRPSRKRLHKLSSLQSTLPQAPARLAVQDESDEREFGNDVDESDERESDSDVVSSGQHSSNYQSNSVVIRSANNTSTSSQFHSFNSRSTRKAKLNQRLTRRQQQQQQKQQRYSQNDQQYSHHIINNSNPHNSIQPINTPNQLNTELSARRRRTIRRHNKPMTNPLEYGSQFEVRDEHTYRNALRFAKFVKMMGL